MTEFILFVLAVLWLAAHVLAARAAAMRFERLEQQIETQEQRINWLAVAVEAIRDGRA